MLMKALFVIHVLAALFILSCRNITGSALSTSDEEKLSSLEKQSFYFDYILDGKEMHVNADEIVSAYYPDKNKTFTIYAGKDDSVLVLLTVGRDIRKPSVTPSGSANPKMNIPMGSVSLQDSPEKNNESHSYNSTSPEGTPVIADAIVITGSQKEGDTARIITGSFHAKTYRGSKETGDEYTEHVIKGKFRIRHEFHSYNGGSF